MTKLEMTEAIILAKAKKKMKKNLKKIDTIFAYMIFIV